MSNSAAPRRAPSIEHCVLPGVLVITPHRHEDSRGYFSEVYNARDLQAAGIETSFIQDNQSFSRRSGTIRGLHFQSPPFAQAKLIRVLRGAVFDVVVDLRSSSATFGKYVAVSLGADDGRQLYVPGGFAHGFCTLEPDTEVFYKVDAPYARDHEGGLAWNDPAVGINWPDLIDESTLLERDRNWPVLHDLADLF